MATLRLLLAASVVLGGVFGSATAELETLEGDRMTVDIEVEVLGEPGNVVAHLAFEDDPVLVLPLLSRGESVYGLTTELEPKNYAVVFEAIGEPPTDPVTLTQLGANLPPELSGGTAATTTTTADGEATRETFRWMWLAVALGAASLSLLAFWVLGGDGGEQAGESGGDG